MMASGIAPNSIAMFDPVNPMNADHAPPFRIKSVSTVHQRVSVIALVRKTVLAVGLEPNVLRSASRVMNSNISTAITAFVVVQVSMSASVRVMVRRQIVSA